VPMNSGEGYSKLRPSLSLLLGLDLFPRSRASL
jgi:hypothetical protein